MWPTYSKRYSTFTVATKGRARSKGTQFQIAGAVRPLGAADCKCNLTRRYPIFLLPT